MWLALIRMQNGQWQITYQLIHMMDDKDAKNGKLCVYMTHTKKDANEWHANTHALSISNMLTITILANDTKWDSLY